jgi:hypothetical protein
MEMRQATTLTLLVRRAMRIGLTWMWVFCAVALSACGSAPGPHCGVDNSGGRGCTCSFTSSPNDFTCTPANANNGVCCADPRWPSPNTYCDCYYPPKCAFASTGGCYCGVLNQVFPGDMPVPSCSAPSGQVCCQDNDYNSCGCGKTVCGGDSHQVKGCPDPSGPPCYPGKVQVSSCS